MEKRDLVVATFNISGGYYIGNEDSEYLDRDTIDGKKFDDLLVHKNILASSRIIRSLSDRYMVVDHIRFEL